MTDAACCLKPATGEGHAHIDSIFGLLGYSVSEGFCFPVVLKYDIPGLICDINAYSISHVGLYPCDVPCFKQLGIWKINTHYSSFIEPWAVYGLWVFVSIKV